MPQNLNVLTSMFGGTESWNFWGPETLRFDVDFGGPENWEVWEVGKFGSLEVGKLVRWEVGSLEVGKLGSWEVRKRVSWELGNLERRDVGKLGSWEV